VTKVFEYLLAGMPVIATRTTENQAVITPERGILIDDSAVSFAEGLRVIAGRLGSYDGPGIAGRSMQYSWAAIVRDNLEPVLRHAMEES
jgi:glycosyltransferase involved in cell wall biosynthesis